jgi:hypothetical protein
VGSVLRAWERKRARGFRVYQCSRATGQAAPSVWLDQELETRKLPQADAAKVLGVTQRSVSALGR